MHSLCICNSRYLRQLIRNGPNKYATLSPLICNYSAVLSSSEGLQRVIVYGFGAWGASFWRAGTLAPTWCTSRTPRRAAWSTATARRGPASCGACARERVCACVRARECGVFNIMIRHVVAAAAAAAAAVPFHSSSKGTATWWRDTSATATSCCSTGSRRCTRCRSCRTVCA